MNNQLGTCSRQGCCNFFKQAATGRPRKYCSENCRQARPIPERRLCAETGIEFQPSRKGQIYINRDAANKAAARMRSKRIFLTNKTLSEAAWESDDKSKFLEGAMDVFVHGEDHEFYDEIHSILRNSDIEFGRSNILSIFRGAMQNPQNIWPDRNIHYQKHYDTESFQNAHKEAISRNASRFPFNDMSKATLAELMNKAFFAVHGIRTYGVRKHEGALPLMGGESPSDIIRPLFSSDWSSTVYCGNIAPRCRRKGLGAAYMESLGYKTTRNIKGKVICNRYENPIAAKYIQEVPVEVEIEDDTSFDKMMDHLKNCGTDISAKLGAGKETAAVIIEPNAENDDCDLMAFVRSRRSNADDAIAALMAGRPEIQMKQYVPQRHRRPDRTVRAGLNQVLVA